MRRTTDWPWPEEDMTGLTTHGNPTHQGEQAHSRYFSEGAYQLLNGDNKELVIVPGASHVDLYDNFDAIPFDKLQAFFGENL